MTRIFVMVPIFFASSRFWAPDLRSRRCGRQLPWSSVSLLTEASVAGTGQAPAQAAAAKSVSLPRLHGAFNAALSHACEPGPVIRLSGCATVTVTVALPLLP